MSDPDKHSHTARSASPLSLTTAAANFLARVSTASNTTGALRPPSCLLELYALLRRARSRRWHDRRIRTFLTALRWCSHGWRSVDFGALSTWLIANRLRLWLRTTQPAEQRLVLSCFEARQTVPARLATCRSRQSQRQATQYQNFTHRILPQNPRARPVRQAMIAQAVAQFPHACLARLETVHVLVQQPYLTLCVVQTQRLLFCNIRGDGQNERTRCHEPLDRCDPHGAMIRRARSEVHFVSCV